MVCLYKNMTCKYCNMYRILAGLSGNSPYSSIYLLLDHCNKNVWTLGTRNLTLLIHCKSNHLHPFSLNFFPYDEKNNLQFRKIHERDTHTHWSSGVNFPVTALMTSWPRIPPIAAHRGAKQPLQVSAKSRRTSRSMEGMGFFRSLFNTSANWSKLLRSASHLWKHETKSWT